MSDEQQSFEYKDMGLAALADALKSDPKVKLGILGGKNSRSNDVKTNAEIGAIHEYGTEKVPQRSWLRQPIIDNLQSYLEKAGAFKASVFKEIIRARTLVPFMRKVGIVGERILQDGFDSGGFGKWAPLSPATVAQKKNDQILVETQQLRNSTTSEVIE